jgi:hypothetical protein
MIGWLDSCQHTVFYNTITQSTAISCFFGSLKNRNLGESANNLRGIYIDGCMNGAIDGRRYVYETLFQIFIH